MYFNFDKNLILNTFKYGTLVICLLCLNYEFAVSFCKELNVSFDFMFSSLSIGFGYELVLLLCIVDLLIIHYFITFFLK